MLKRTIFLFLILMLAASAWGQNASVKKIETLTTLKDGEFCFPRMNQNGSKVFFSTTNYIGLYSCDLNNRSIIKLTDEKGAGYQSAINSQGTELVYRTFNIVQGRRYFSLVKKDLLDNKRTVLESSIREISTAKYLDDGLVGYAVNARLKKNITNPSLNKRGGLNNNSLVIIENKKIALYDGENKTILEPRGEGSYIWPEVSPEGQRLLFKKLGDGCYISDLEGNILSELGNINAPHWSPDGKWIVYMADKDDGYRLMESEIHIKKIDGSIDFKLTDTEDIIEIYPDWGPDKNTIVFCSAKGQIYLMHLGWE